MPGDESWAHTEELFKQALGLNARRGRPVTIFYHDLSKVVSMAVQANSPVSASAILRGKVLRFEAGAIAVGVGSAATLFEDLSKGNPFFVSCFTVWYCP